MTVLRRWPTCIGLATLGLLKSMTTVSGSPACGTPRCSSEGSAATPSATTPPRTVRLMNPGPATSGVSHRSARPAASTSSAATSRGGLPSVLASGIAMFA